MINENLRLDHFYFNVEFAVPIRIWLLERMPEEERQRTIAEWATDALVVLPHASFAMPREAPEASFTHLARGLAALAFQPGGVDFGRLHFEAGRG